MLDKKLFVQGIKQLNYTYPKFNFPPKEDLDNEKNYYEAWYAVLEDLTDEQFKYACKTYTKTNKFEPRGPACLTELVYQREEQQIKNNTQSADEAWQLVRNTNRSYAIGSKLFYDRVSKVNTIAAKVSEGFVNELKPPAESKQWDITSHAWKKAYDIEVKRVISNKQLGLDSTEYQRLVKGNLMIESSDKNDN